MRKNGLLEIIAAHRTLKDLDELIKRDKYYQDALAEEQSASDIMDSLTLRLSRKKPLTVSLRHIMNVAWHMAL